MHIIIILLNRCIYFQRNALAIPRNGVPRQQSSSSCRHNDTAQPDLRNMPWYIYDIYIHLVGIYTLAGSAVRDICYSGQVDSLETSASLTSGITGWRCAGNAGYFMRARRGIMWQLMGLGAGVQDTVIDVATETSSPFLIGILVYEYVAILWGTGEVNKVMTVS